MIEYLYRARIRHHLGSDWRAQRNAYTGLLGKGLAQRPDVSGACLGIPKQGARYFEAKGQCILYLGPVSI